MKTLTLHQPWASLVALGVKSIETRSWSAPARLELGAVMAEQGEVVGTFCDACGGAWDFDEPCTCECAPRARRWGPVRQGSLADFVGLNARCWCGADLGMAEVPEDAVAAMAAHVREAHPEVG